MHFCILACAFWWRLFGTTFRPLKRPAMCCTFCLKPHSILAVVPIIGHFHASPLLTNKSHKHRQLSQTSLSCVAFWLRCPLLGIDGYTSPLQLSSRRQLPHVWQSLLPPLSCKPCSHKQVPLLMPPLSCKLSQATLSCVASLLQATPSCVAISPATTCMQACFSQALHHV